MNTRSYGVSPSIAFGIGSLTQIGLSWLTQHNNDHIDYGFPMFQFKNEPILKPLQAPFGRTYQYTNAVVRTDVNIFNISLSHTFSPDAVFRSNTQYGIYNVHQNTAPLNTVFEALDANGNYQPVQPSSILAPPATPLDELAIAPQQKQRDGRDSSLFNQTDLLFKFATGPMRHELIVGGEFGRDEYHQLFFNNYNFNLNNGASLGANLAGVINLGSTNTQPFPSGAHVYQVPRCSMRTNFARALPIPTVRDQQSVHALWQRARLHAVRHDRRVHCREVGPATQRRECAQP